MKQVTENGLDNQGFFNLYLDREGLRNNFRFFILLWVRFSPAV